MQRYTEAIKGRGATDNIKNRFEALDYQIDFDVTDQTILDEGIPRPKTQFFKDNAKTVLSYNKSPDIPFAISLNPYRGCEHGCIYCFARPNHEYLGFSAGLDFETKILVKENAPEVLRAELMAKSYKPQPVTIGIISDAYQPIERKIKLTRRCLEVFLDFKNPIGIVTKNYLVTRDRDILAQLAKYNAARVLVSVTTLDDQLHHVMEPRTSTPQGRLDAIKVLSGAGVPTSVMIGPVIPGLTDHELPHIIEAAAKAGASSAVFVPLRLPHAVAPLFENWLGTHFPERKEKVLNRIRDIRGGKLNDPNFHSRFKAQGIYGEQIRKMYDVACRKAGLYGFTPLSTQHFKRPGPEQLGLF